MHYYLNSKNETVSLKIVAFTDVNGVAQENNIHYKGKDLITDPKQKVLVINHYSDGTNGQEFKESLTPDENKVFNDRTLIKSERMVSGNDGKGSGFEYENGDYVGNKFDNTYKIKVAEKQLIPTLMKGKLINPDSDNNGSPVPIMQTVKSLSSTIDKYKKEYLQKNPANKIDNIKINLRTTPTNSTYIGQVLNELKKANPELNINLKIDKNFKQKDSAFEFNLETKITGGKK